jgi:hypothetical protein
MEIKYIDIDLTNLRNLSGKLDPEVPLELLLVTHYKMVNDNSKNTMEIVTGLISKHLYKSDTIGDYNDILTFFKEKSFSTHIIKFYSMLEHLILKEVSPYVVDVEFDSVVSENPYVVKFKYWI